MNSSNWAQIIVAVVALLSAVFAQRSAASASKYNTRTQAETEAYERARKLDTETIARQERDIEKLRERVDNLVAEKDKLKKENESLKKRVDRLEKTKEDKHE